MKYALYRRSGIVPCPEDGIDIVLLTIIIHKIYKFARKNVLINSFPHFELFDPEQKTSKEYSL